MKKLFFFFAMLLPILGLSQGIRKNYTEMTSAEQDAYVGALNGLYNDNPDLDIMQTLYNNYWNYFYQVYYRSCDQSPFLHFHRMMIWEMENALQRKNPRLTVPYWDWTVNNGVDDPLFTSFLSPERFPSGWYFYRNIGEIGSLPTASQVQSIQGLSSFCDLNNASNSYTDQTSGLDYNVKLWVGGTMSLNDPYDPLFYSHAAMLDKLWEDWQQVHNNSSINLSVLPRYDGYTGSVYISPLPATNPNNIVDSRQQGIFYASNGVANLNGGYSVTNTFMTPEYFSYPNQIVAGSFSVGPGKSAVIVSKTKVILQSPFIVNNGTLTINVGTGYYENFPLAKTGMGEQKSFAQSSPGTDQNKFAIVRASGGFTARLWLHNASQVQGYVTSIDGKIVSKLIQNERLDQGYHEFQLKVPHGGALYYAYFRAGNQTFKRLLPRF